MPDERRGQETTRSSQARWSSICSGNTTRDPASEQGYGAVRTPRQASGFLWRALSHAYIQRLKQRMYKTAAQVYSILVMPHKSLKSLHIMNMQFINVTESFLIFKSYRKKNGLGVVVPTLTSAFRRYKQECELQVSLGYGRPCPKHKRNKAKTARCTDGIFTGLFFLILPLLHGDRLWYQEPTVTS